MHSVSIYRYLLFGILSLELRDVSGVIYFNTYADVGAITGKIDNLVYRNRTYQYVSYLGIPYAKFPMEGSRFKKVVLQDSLPGYYNATYFRPPCLQTGFKSTKVMASENCLFLNIYAPIDSTINPKKKYPVVIYIHGGNFVVGATNDVSLENLAVAGDIIIVTVNYRLGILGFLNSGDAFARGNLGLWDQHVAIRWVRYNINAFGGDVNSITLMGHEAGAVCVMLQSLYPGNRGLFHRIVALSGTSVSPWALHGVNNRDIAKELDCYDETNDFHFSNEPLLHCIRNKPVMEIMNMQPSIRNLGPTIDGDFLMDHPMKIIRAEDNHRYQDARDFFRSLDIIIGITENDGSEEILSLFSEEFGVSSIDGVRMKSDEFEQIIIPDMLEPVYNNEQLLINRTIGVLTRNNIKQSVRFQYTNWTDPDNPISFRQNLLRLSTDANFVVPAVKVADAHSYINYNASTYMYKFTHRMSYNSRDPKWILSATHGSELLPMLGFPAEMMKKAGLERSLIPDSEYRLAERMMTWISNFAKTG